MFAHPDLVADATREAVEAAAGELGYRKGAPTGDLAAHWRRTNFNGRLFQPAATGRYPTKAASRGPVPVQASPWLGIPVRGRNAAARADACWVPIAPGLTPHGLRHTYKDAHG